MDTSTDKIAVTLCCSEADLDRVQALADILEREALEVHVCAGAEIDTRRLARHMARPRAPGVFVMCESVALDGELVSEVEDRYEVMHKELDQLVRIHLEHASPDENLERIRDRVAVLAGGPREEDTLNAGLPSQPADISDAIALAQRLVEANKARAQPARPDSGAVPAEASAPGEDKAAVEDTPAPAPEPAAEDTPAPEPSPEPAAEAEAPAAPTRPRSRALPAVAVVLVLLLGAGGVWLAWDRGMIDLGALTGTPVATAEDAPAQPVEPTPEDPPPAPEDQRPEPELEDPPPEPELELDEATTGLDASLSETGTLDEAALEPGASAVEAVEAGGKRPPKLGMIQKLGDLRVAPVTEARFYWRDASNHCRLNKRDGTLGWRLASIKQLEQLHEAGKLDPGTYWSTTLAIVGSTQNFVLDTSEPQPRGEEKTEFQALALCVLSP